MIKQVKQLRFLQYYTVTSTVLLGLLSLAAFKQSGDNLRLDELTVKRINVVDSTGQVRVTLAGSYPPRRTEVAGLLFVNNDGGEAGGLVYRGYKNADGQVLAGGILTMDQYNNDQIVALVRSRRAPKATGIDDPGPARQPGPRAPDALPRAGQDAEGRQVGFHVPRARS